MRNSTRLLLALFFVVDLVVALYFVVGYVLYNQLTDVSNTCQRFEANTPAAFSDITNYWGQFDELNYANYAMPTYEDVRFPSRQEGINISGWYVEADPAAPAVIVVHGFGGCRRSVTELTPAGMLYNAGFNVLIIDLRDVGDSDYEDGRSAIGNEEHLDALGAWDWLMQEKGYNAEKIGMLGNSLGAATTLIAFSQEPNLAAVFVDSPYSNLPQIIDEELIREGYPTFLRPGGLIMAQLIAGDDLVAYNPSDALTNAGSRPVYILHGTADTRVAFHHTEQLQEQGKSLGVNLTVWVIEGLDHNYAAGAFPEEYQARLVGFFTEALQK